ncbi:MAG: Stp1/IreP family PP2C-type Ser/Thr phosphatase [Actinomycetota bacterium]
MPLTVRETGACTDVGRLRQSNEDALVLADPVFAVADGMGGARAGEVASAMAVAALYGFAGGADGLVAALEDVNDRIHAAAQADGSLAGMGTTATAALVTRDELVIAHVGDSRAYLLRDGRLRQVTDDHSLVAELIRRGALTPAEAERHPQRSVITRALGAEPDVEVDVVRLVPQAGDVLLLCSDGLTGMVGDGEIGRIVGEPGPLPERARELVQAANGAGGEDNVTVVLVRIGERGEEDTEPERSGPTIIPASAASLAGAGAAPPRTAQARGRRRGRGALVAAALAALGIAVAVVVAAGLQWAHFVGATDDGMVAVYQGLPVEITADMTLYRPVRVTAVQAAALDAEARAALLDQRIGSRASADGRVDDLLASAPWLATPATTP